jgi:hypothetical protein
MDVGRSPGRRAPLARAKRVGCRNRIVMLRQRDPTRLSHQPSSGMTPPCASWWRRRSRFRIRPLLLNGPIPAPAPACRANTFAGLTKFPGHKWRTQANSGCWSTRFSRGSPGRVRTRRWLPMVRARVALLRGKGVGKIAKKIEPRGTKEGVARGSDRRAEAEVGMRVRTMCERTECPHVPALDRRLLPRQTEPSICRPFRKSLWGKETGFGQDACAGDRVGVGSDCASC